MSRKKHCLSLFKILLNSTFILATEGRFFHLFTAKLLLPVEGVNAFGPLVGQYLVDIVQNDLSSGGAFPPLFCLNEAQ